MNYIDHIKGYLSRAALLLLMAGGALMAGCEDFLVRDVPNQTTDEEWWQNKGQLNTALNNLYKPMPSGTSPMSITMSSSRRRAAIPMPAWRWRH